jgi:hypothetical protein
LVKIRKKMDLKNYFVSKEQSESLKELGFKEECLAYYRENGEFTTNPSYKNIATSAPLIMQAIDWLSNELGNDVTGVDSGIRALKAIRKRINVTVSLTFEVYQRNKTYEDGHYLIITNESTYPESIQILYGECTDYNGVMYDDCAISFISPSFEVIHE